MDSVKFIRAGRYVSPDGEDLGAVVEVVEAENIQAPDSRTVAQLKQALDAAQVVYAADAKRDDLLKLAADKGI